MRLAVFASGSGSNFEAIARAIQSGALDASIALCLSNRKDAGVLDRAETFRIPHVVLVASEYESVPLYELALLETLDSYGVTHIALAGYLKMIPASIVSRFEGHIVNIHPALLPAFGGKGMYGIHVHRAVLTSGVTESGATIHLVDQEYDSGRILRQERVPVYKTDTPESLAARVLEVEHRLYPIALQEMIVQQNSQPNPLLPDTA